VFYNVVYCRVPLSNHCVIIWRAYKAIRSTIHTVIQSASRNQHILLGHINIHEDLIKKSIGFCLEFERNLVILKNVRFSKKIYSVFERIVHKLQFFHCKFTSVLSYYWYAHISKITIKACIAYRIIIYMFGF
jgi:hypothetical protein